MVLRTESHTMHEDPLPIPQDMLPTGSQPHFQDTHDLFVVFVPDRILASSDGLCHSAVFSVYENGWNIQIALNDTNYCTELRMWSCIILIEQNWILGFQRLVRIEKVSHHPWTCPSQDTPGNGTSGNGVVYLKGTKRFVGPVERWCVHVWNIPQCRWGFTVR